MTKPNEATHLRLLQALTLNERLQLAQQHPAIQQELEGITLTDEDTKRLTYFYPEQNEAFNRHTSATRSRFGLSQNAFNALLTDQYLLLLQQHLTTQQYPRWYQQLVRLYQQPYPDGLRLSDLYRKHVALTQFFDPFEPIIRLARTELKAAITAQLHGLENLRFDYTLLERELLSDVSATIFEMIDRTLVLEMNIAKLQEQLKGETPQERFQDFINQIVGPDKLNELLQDYPILFRKTYDFVMQWVVVSTELACRLNADVDAIAATFGVADATRLVKLHINAGDKHMGNRTVVIVHFADGNKVVYKPRPLTIDIHFQQMLQWYNSLGLATPLKVMTILDKGEYGYAEHIAHVTCEEDQQLNRFYQRIGALLALLYSINATDFHHENIIAHGEQPVLIDLESLFHSTAARGYDPVDETMNRQIQNSVLHIQLLPFKIYYAGKAVDISGITNTTGVEAPAPVPVWQAEATDEMKITHMKATLTGSKNAPTKGASKGNLVQYTQTIKESFYASYQLLLANKEQLIQQVNVFAHDHIRLLVRATSVYNNLLKTAFHTDYLQGFAYRQKLAQYLWHKVNDVPSFEPIVPAELEAMEAKDVPYFHTIANSRDLYSQGQVIATDYFPETGLEAVHQKIAALSQADCAQQCWYIEASLAASITNQDEMSWHDRHYYSGPAASPATQRQLTGPALQLAHRMNTMHTQINDISHWAGLILTGSQQYDVKPLMMDTYSGLPGVALFLAASYAESGEPGHLALLKGTLNNMQRLMDRYIGLSFTKRMGAYDGWFGLTYTLHVASQLVNEPQIKAMYQRALDFTLKHVADVKGYDVLTGAAGAILCLKAIYRSQPEQRLANAMTTLGEKIVAGAQPAATGMGWINEEGSTQLAGFGHGAAGIIAALAELNDLSPDHRYTDLIDAALAFERSAFDTGSGNWRDLRQVIQEQTASKPFKGMVAWCHGATGVGIGRLILLQHRPDATIEAEVRQAIATVLSAGFGKNHSLCHGDVGNLCFLLAAARQLNDEMLEAQTLKIAHAIAKAIKQKGPIGGIAMGVENPGLMVGNAGIGYGLLHLAKPERYPSILALAPLNSHAHVPASY